MLVMFSSGLVSIDGTEIENCHSLIILMLIGLSMAFFFFFIANLYSPVLVPLLSFSFSISSSHMCSCRSSLPPLTCFLGRLSKT